MSSTKSMPAKVSRNNPLGRFLSQKFLFAFACAGVAGFVAGFIHSGYAIIAFPIFAWSPFILFISLHAVFDARTVGEKLFASALTSFAIALPIAVWRIL